MSFSFPRSEKLKSAKTIERLFKEGKSLTSFPVRLIYLEQSSVPVTRAAFAVPKRNFKTAVSRNRIKRQLREAYRTNKQLFTANNGRNFAFLFLYIGKNRPHYSEIKAAIEELLKKLADEIN